MYQGPQPIADGANVTQGAIADAAVTGDSAGTIAAKLRGLIKMLGDVWDSGNHKLNVALATLPAPSSLPLPAGAATASAQTDGTQKSKVVDSGGDVAEVVAPTNAAAVSAWADKGLRVLIGPTDVISNLPVVVDYDHHQLHEGETFRWSYANLVGLNSGSAEYFVFTVPNITIPAGNSAVGLCPHFRFEFVADSYSQVLLYEGPTVTAATGSARTPVSMERNGTYTPKLTILELPTVTVDGTMLWQGVIFTSKTSAGGTTSSANEFVLKNNTKYAVKVASLTNGLKYLVRFVWYEDLGV